MSENILSNIWFRLLAPLFIGIVVYLLVLMFFDALTYIADNFFGLELLVTIIITYAVFMVLRQLNHLWQNLFSDAKSHQTILIVQFSTGIMLSSLLTWGLVSIYFKYVLGYSQYLREGIIFISLFSFISITYNILHVSIYYLNKSNAEAVEKEEQMKNKLVNEFNGLLRDTRPELFTIGMEALLVQLRKNKKEADQYITTFCDVYRYSLQSRHNELTELRHELNNMNNLIRILNSKYENNITFEHEVTTNQLSYQLLPTTLQILTEVSVFSSIINKDSPMKIHLSIDKDNKLIFTQNGLAGLTKKHIYEDVSYLSVSQKYYTGHEILTTYDNRLQIFSIPLITNNIDELE
jgi:sensor histidine kinase YesM